MRCYFHENREAVAQCNNCGKLLCKECAEKWEPPICPDCGKNEEAKNKKSMKVTVVLSVVLGLEGFCIGLLPLVGSFAGGKFNFGFFLFSLVYCALFTFALAGIPFGWRYLNKITSKMFLFLPLIGWFVYLGVKLFLSVFAGMYALPKYIIDRRKGKA